MCFKSREQILEALSVANERLKELRPKNCGQVYTWHPADGSGGEQENGTLRLQLIAEEQKFRSLHKVLQMWDNNTYGVCAKCGHAIDPRRLKAVSNATLCIDCKTELEQANFRFT